MSLPEGCPESLIPWAVLASPLNPCRARIPAWGNALCIFGLSAFAYTPFCQGLPSCEGLALSSSARGMLTAHGMRLF